MGLFDPFPSLQPQAWKDPCMLMSKEVLAPASQCIAPGKERA